MRYLLDIVHCLSLYYCTFIQQKRQSNEYHLSDNIGNQIQLGSHITSKAVNKFLEKENTIVPAALQR